MKSLRSLLVFLLLAAMLSACWKSGVGPQGAQNAGKPGDPKWGKPEKPKFKIPVTVAQLKRGRMYAYLQAVGTVVPMKEIELKPEMMARIYYTKRWLEGDEVKKNEKFASMDDRELNIRINEADLNLELSKSAVMPAKAQLDKASKDVEFRKAMLDRGAISKSEYDQAVLTCIQQDNRYEQAQKDVFARQMALDKLKQEQEKVDIIFPFDGILLPAKQSLASSQREGNETDLTLLNGLQVGTGTVLCRLADLDRVYVALDVPAKDLLDIKEGMVVELEIYSRVGATYTGTVKEISTGLNASTRTYTVNVLVENPKHELRPGMFAKARIITDEKIDAISIPRELVLLRNNRSVVFAVKEKPKEEQKDGVQKESPTPSKSEDKAIAKKEGFEKVAQAAEEIKKTSDEANLTPEEEEFAEFKEFLAPTPAPEPISYIAEEREVTTGIENREFVEIINGLKEGDQLVVLGYETLTDGVDISITIREENFDETVKPLNPTN
ncbi:MAG: efflux RND transporter periplasmic adaptor subunit [Candidatus Omnitrophota bacterium]